MRVRLSTTVVCIGGCLTVLALTSCGGGEGGSPASPTSVTPTTPTVQVLPTQTFTTLGPGAAQFSDLRIDASGVTADIEANWTFATNDVDIFVTGPSCATASFETLFLQIGACANLARGIGVTRPERVSASLAPGSYRVYVANSPLSSSPESGTLAITLRR